MAAPDTLLHSAPATADTRASGGVERAAPPPALVRRSRLACRACGEPWFGAVAFCPYCGRPSAPRSAAPLPRPEPRPERQQSAARTPQAVAHQAPAHPDAARETTSVAAPAREPRLRRITRSAVTVSAAIVLALLALGLQDVLDRTTRARTPAPVRPAAVAPAPQAAEPEPAPTAAPPPAPPARNRSLCSAANEAAGLCNPN